MEMISCALSVKGTNKVLWQTHLHSITKSGINQSTDGGSRVIGYGTLITAFFNEQQCSPSSSVAKPSSAANGTMERNENTKTRTSS